MGAAKAAGTATSKLAAPAISAVPDWIPRTPPETRRAFSPHKPIGKWKSVPAPERERSAITNVGPLTLSTPRLREDALASQPKSSSRGDADVDAKTATKSSSSKSAPSRESSPRRQDKGRSRDRELPPRAASRSRSPPHAASRSRSAPRASRNTESGHEASSSSSPPRELSRKRGKPFADEDIAKLAKR